MHYQPYFNLALFHDYYQKQICPDFTIEPTRVCQRILKGHRLVFKPSINGLQLLMPVESDQQTVLALDKSLIFTFLLRLKNSDFVTFTQLDPLYHPDRSLYVFSNDGTNTSSLALTLIQRQKLAQPKSEQSPLEARCAAIAELHTVPASQLFGVIEIHHHDFPKGANQNRDFTITFVAKKQIWKYYLITDKSTSATAFSIQPKDAAIRFSPFKGDTSDRILAGIQQRFPESQTVLLRSDTPVACREIGRPNLQLFKKGNDKEQDKLWISNLPNPPNQHGTQVINMLEEV